MPAILTDNVIKKAKPREKTYRLSDTDGLYIEIAPNGGKRWRFRYRFQGKYNMMSLGLYPAVSLKQARQRRDEARQRLSDGNDPSGLFKPTDTDLGYSAPTFSHLSEEWFEFKKKTWSETYAKRLLTRMKKYVPMIPDKPVDMLELEDFLPVLKKIEGQGHYETCKVVAQFCSQICKYAKAKRLIRHNPLDDVHELLVPPRHKPMAAILDPLKVGHLLADIEDYHGFLSTRIALQIMPYVFVRSGELRMAVWDEIDFEKALWTIPAERMKMRKPHTVPLAPQVSRKFQALRELNLSHKLCFPSPYSRTQPISDMCLLNALRRIGYSREEMCIHGFRSIASTFLNEQSYRPDIIEMQLAHADKNAIRAIYNRSTYIEERTKMMCEWADFLDGLRDSALEKRNGKKL